ncbi:hypothetical protein ABIE67_005156 [Streptomyces sp. V4I8]
MERGVPAHRVQMQVRGRAAVLVEPVEVPDGVSQHGDDVTRHHRIGHDEVLGEHLRQAPGVEGEQSGEAQ